MITGEMVEKAIETGHDECNLVGCVHHAAISAAREAIMARANEVVIITLTDPSAVPTEIGLLIEGIHIGHRLAQLETAQSEVNYAVNKKFDSIQ